MKALTFMLFFIATQVIVLLTFSQVQTRAQTVISVFPTENTMRQIASDEQKIENLFIPNYNSSSGIFSKETLTRF
jgi:hypothetical protein